MDYLLDTNTVSAIMEDHLATVWRVTRIAPTDSAHFSAITQGELLFGLLNALLPKQARLGEKITAAFELLGAAIPIDGAVAQAYGAIRYDLKAKGRPRPDNDMWIAATAMANHYILVSHDEGFRHVAGLRLEDWVA